VEFIGDIRARWHSLTDRGGSPPKQTLPFRCYILVGRVSSAVRAFQAHHRLRSGQSGSECCLAGGHSALTGVPVRGHALACTSAGSAVCYTRVRWKWKKIVWRGLGRLHDVRIRIKRNRCA